VRSVCLCASACPVCVPAPPGVFLPVSMGEENVVRVTVNTTDATTGATALLLPAQNTHTLHDPIRATEHAHARALAALRMVWASAAWMAVEMLAQRGA
jgi:hypothetical protein